MNNWISIQENLPKTNDSFLVVYRGQILIRMWNPDEVCWDDEDGDDYWKDVNDVSHWMPLPEPPKD